MVRTEIHPASFRDPSGFIYQDAQGVLYRQVNRCYQQQFTALMDSGLYEALTERNLLIEHDELALEKRHSDSAFRVLRPRQLHFISYAYEWSFSALKEAALLTLRVQEEALKRDMTLKDATHFNIQFDGIRPVFIDTLSFERYSPGEPWVAYAQFCRHFLAPLALMAKTHIDLNRMLWLHLDGIPLDIASKLLPGRTRLSPAMLLHIHLQAKLVRRYADTSRETAKSVKRLRVSKQGLLSLVRSLHRIVSQLSWKAANTEWVNYYEDNTYGDEAIEQKRTAVRKYLTEARPDIVYDLGANTGVFSRIAAELGAHTYAFDIDPGCVERLFLDVRNQGQQHILPLQLDLANPTPPLGWAHCERLSFVDRGRADVVMALALIHHLAISNNLSLRQVAELFAKLCKHLIIEFVPKDDPQVQRLLQSREDIFAEYDQAHFERTFFEYFEPVDSQEIIGRTLYFMRTKTLSSCA